MTDTFTFQGAVDTHTPDGTALNDALLATFRRRPSVVTSAGYTSGEVTVRGHAFTEEDYASLHSQIGGPVSLRVEAIGADQMRITLGTSGLKRARMGIHLALGVLVCMASVAASVLTVFALNDRGFLAVD
jgi:hypothetical protein